MCERWVPPPWRGWPYRSPATAPRATHHPEEALGQLLQLGGLLIAAPREEPGPREVTPWPRADDSQSRGRFRVAAPGPAAVPGVPACGVDGGLAGDGSGEGCEEAEWTEGGPGLGRPWAAATVGSGRGHLVGPAQLLQRRSCFQKGKHGSCEWVAMDGT